MDERPARAERGVVAENFVAKLSEPSTTTSAPTSASAFPASKRRSRASTATEQRPEPRRRGDRLARPTSASLKRLPVQVRRLDGVVLDQDRRSLPPAASVSRARPMNPPARR